MGLMVDVGHVEAFLATRFGSDDETVVHLATGVWSKAFAFRWAGRDYVNRFGAHREDFAKDRLALGRDSSARLWPFGL